MKLTKLSAAWLPAWTCRLMPASVNGMDAGTASQLIPGVGLTWQVTKDPGMIATQAVDHVSYEIYGLAPDGARHAIAQGKREYSVDNDIRVEQRTDGTGLVFWVKS